MSSDLKPMPYWADKHLYHDAEKRYYESLSNICNGTTTATCPTAKKISPLANEIKKARAFIQTSLENVNPQPSKPQATDSHLVEIIEKLQKHVQILEKRLTDLEVKCCNVIGHKEVEIKKQLEQKPKSDDDDDVDLFGSESEEDDEAIKLKEKRLAEYAEKKSKKPALIAKSSILLEVKPWDDETDMVALEKAVRAIEMDGLLWGVSKLVPVAFGVKKLQITCVVEDDKVSVDELSEKIEENEDYVQSVDIAAFNKI